MLKDASALGKKHERCFTRQRANEQLSFLQNSLVSFAVSQIQSLLQVLVLQGNEQDIRQLQIFLVSKSNDRIESPNAVLRHPVSLIDSNRVSLKYPDVAILRVVPTTKFREHNRQGRKAIKCQQHEIENYVAVVDFAFRVVARWPFLESATFYGFVQPVVNGLHSQNQTTLLSISTGSYWKTDHVFALHCGRSTFESSPAPVSMT